MLGKTSRGAGILVSAADKFYNPADDGGVLLGKPGQATKFRQERPEIRASPSFAESRIRQELGKFYEITSYRRRRIYRIAVYS